MAILFLWAFAVVLEQMQKLREKYALYWKVFNQNDIKTGFFSKTMQNHTIICTILLFFFSACLFSSFVQDSLANLIGLKTTYIFGLAMFGLSMFFTVVFPSVVVLNICAAFSGLGFAVATTIPCSLLTRYHQQPDLFFRDTRPIGAFTGKNLWIRGLLMSV